MDNDRYARVQAATIVKRCKKSEIEVHLARAFREKSEAQQGASERIALLSAKVAALEEQVKGLSDVKRAVEAVVKLHSSTAPVDSRQLTFMGKEPSPARDLPAGDVLEDIYRYADDICTAIETAGMEDESEAMLAALGKTEHEWDLQRSWR